MLIKTYKLVFLKELSFLYDKKEVESFFYIILEEIHNIKRIDLALNPEIKIDLLQLNRWNAILTELKNQKPIQYILGKTEFYGLPFIVDSNTLIPRPETEELVNLIINKSKIKTNSSKIEILDIGTGTGCIAISLAKNIPNSSVFAIDVSKKALQIAKKNAQNNKVLVTFIQQDILKMNDLNQYFDVIVSNPPYVRELEKAEINKNVLDYEPHLALFVKNDDALLFYRKIAQLALKNLKPNGQLFFEINQYLGKETVELLENMDFKNIKLKKDIYGNDRMICCVK